MRWAALDPSSPLLCLHYIRSGHFSLFSLLLGPINNTLEGWGSLPLLYSRFACFKLGVCHKQIFIPIIK
jgi:hypothetical protein